MVDIRGFHPDDLAAFEPQNQQRLEMQAIDWRRMICQAAASGPAWSGLHRGRVIGCAGLAIYWRGRANCWCMIAADVPAHVWPSIHRAVATRLDQAKHIGVWRIEAETAIDFEAGQRWLAMLGFEAEGIARAYGPSGHDFVRYARIDRAVVAYERLTQTAAVSG